MSGSPARQTRQSYHEAAHKLGSAAHDHPDRRAPRTAARRSFNEAAHKLGHWPIHPDAPREPSGPSAALRAAYDDQRDVVAHAGRIVLALGALGIVYGDIGTSPLYTEQIIFTAHRDAAHPTPAGIYGVVSLIFWAASPIERFGLPAERTVTMGSQVAL